MIKADADQLGLVGRIQHSVPTEMDVDAGTVGRGLVWDTLSGRRPLDRLEECIAHQDTARRLGTALPAHAFNDEAVGRVLDRLYDRGTLQLVTACAVRAVTRFGLERRDGHFDPTARRVWGEDPVAEEQDVPFSVTSGDRQDQRPDLQPFGRSLRCVERAGPLWGTPEEGTASATTLQTTRVSESAQLLARHGVQPGAYLDMADAALVTEDTRAALGDRVFMTRVPATSSACARVSAEAGAHHRGEAVGGLAQTPPTQPRPTTFDQVAAGRVT